MISERALIERLAASAAVRAGVALGIGDDAAVLSGDPAMVVTQDVLVDGVHFRRATASLGDIGHKAIAVNLSDVAAMGAAPIALFIGLVLPDPEQLTTADIDELYAGMESLAGVHGATIAGGDTTTGPALILAVTAVGRMAPGVAPVRRTGATAGDLLCVTGSVGAAAAGVLVLDDPALAAGVAQAAALRDAARRPTPRVGAGQHLAAAGVTAMLDCSDGLALDALRLSRASGVIVELDLADIPIARGVAEVAANATRDADLLAATGGEDYELIVTVAPQRLDAARRELEVPLTPIGRVVAGAPTLRVMRAGEAVSLSSLGWEHPVGDAERR